MKKLSILLLSFFCLCSLNAYATHNGCCHNNNTPVKKSCETPCQKPAENVCEKPCPQPCKTPCSTDRFLCTKVNLDTLAKCINLSSSQLCNAHKIHEKYEQEVYSYNDRIQCEKQKLCEMEKTCTNKSDIRKQKRNIKNYENEKKKICKCYEKQFKATLSKDQIRQYNKAKKGQ